MLQTHLKHPLREWRQFWENYRYLPWLLGLLVVLAYGTRIVHDNIFLDSELMIVRPALMQRTWITSSRFGMTLTSRLFGQGRLIPFWSAALAALMMWASSCFLSFCCYHWTGHSKAFFAFLYLFPALFVTSPLFAEQFLFILQAFELSFAILLSIAAVFCIGQYVYHGKIPWLIPGLAFMVWAFGTYQSMPGLYISLVLISFILYYVSGNSQHALKYGLKHIAVFSVGFLLYLAAAALIKELAVDDSAYIDNQFHWGKDSLDTCIFYVKEAVKPILKGESIFFRKTYVPVMVLSTFLAMVHGWKNKHGIVNYLWFLTGLGLFALSPFFLILVTGWVLPLRTQLVYPLTSAFFMAFLTVWNLPSPKSGSLKTAVSRMISAALILFGVFGVIKNGQSMSQLYETSWEAYRNDVLTANRIYSDLCRVAGDRDISEYRVAFIGGRNAGLTDNAVRGELVGLSFFEAEAHTPGGISGRIGDLFSILGLRITTITQNDQELYRELAASVKERPDWPCEGSITRKEDFIIIKLSDGLSP